MKGTAGWDWGGDRERMRRKRTTVVWSNVHTGRLFDDILRK